MKKLLAIYGSPSKTGSSAFLLNSFLKSINTKKIKIEKIFSFDKKIKPCSSCGFCIKNGKCKIKDEMQPIYEKLQNADFIIVSSPIYFLHLPSELKKIIDRTQALWVEKYLRKKSFSKNKERYGIVFFVAAHSSKNIFNCATKTVKAFFNVCNVNFYKKISVPLVDAKASVKSDRLILVKLSSLARQVNSLA